jgi:hypothetical protein
LGTKNNPGAFDCYANAAPDEPMFVLLGRDPLAPFVVALWAKLRALTRGHDAKVEEASKCLRMMWDWTLGERISADGPKVRDHATALAAFDLLVKSRGDFIDVAADTPVPANLRSEGVAIPKAEYESLLRAADKLRKLEDAGVDNWPGYLDAVTGP